MDNPRPSFLKRKFLSRHVSATRLRARQDTWSVRESGKSSNQTRLLRSSEIAVTQTLISLIFFEQYNP